LPVTDKIPREWDRPAQSAQVFAPGSLDQQPQPRLQASPQYPYEMKRQGIEGTVVVEFIVDPEGNVRNAAIVSTPNEEFSDSALAAVGKWVFRAGRKDGRAVYTRMRVPMEFVLDHAQ
jgi:periplasmic protein TonB